MDNQDQSRIIASRLAEIGSVTRPCQPLHSEYVRLAQWNIEKGKRFDLIQKCLASDAIGPVDILCLNEADYGMARSGNRHVAFELADRLNMNVAFGPAFYEFTKGVGEERLAEGHNAFGVQGNAVLTRFPVIDCRNLRLPTCHDPLSSEEKRAGGRSALIVRTDKFAVVVTHLEVLTTRRCRSQQMKFILDNLEPEVPTVIAGDLNTNTFDRGSAFLTMKSTSWLLRRNVMYRVTHAWEFEPLFRELEMRGFSWQQFNDRDATALVDLTSLDDKKYIPAFLRKLALKRGRYLPLRLDWIACRGFRALAPARTIKELPHDASDHLPIMCDLVPLSGKH